MYFTYQIQDDAASDEVLSEVKIESETQPNKQSDIQLAMVKEQKIKR